MESEKVKEIKIVLKGLVDDASNWLQNAMIGGVNLADILTLINELETENTQLRFANKLYAVELGKKGKQEYENIITDVRIDTLKDFREKYKEALKQEANGENVDCFVESLKMFDKTLKEFIND